MSSIQETNEFWLNHAKGELFFCKDITDNTLFEMTRALSELSDSPAKEIKLYISSRGGATNIAAALYDYIITYEKPIHTIALGTVASAAITLLLAGEKRFSMPSTTFMIHHATWAGGDYKYTRESLASQAKINTDLDNRYLDLICARSKISKENLLELLAKEGDWYFNAEAALNMGLIDGLTSMPNVSTPK